LETLQYISKYGQQIIIAFIILKKESLRFMNEVLFVIIRP